MSDETTIPSEEEVVVPATPEETPTEATPAEEVVPTETEATPVA